MIEIKKDSLSALIDPEKDGALVQLTQEGTEYLCRTEEHPGGGAFFPLPEGNYRWTVANQQPDRATLVLEAGDEGDLFRVEMTYALEWNLLAVYLKVRSTGDVPLDFGYRCCFPLECLDNLEAEIRAGMRLEQGAPNASPFGHDILRLSIPRNADVAGAALFPLHSPAVFHIPKEGRQITLAFDSGFNHMVVQARKGQKSFMAQLERASDAPPAPGEAWEVCLRIRPQNID